jgi:cyclase
MADTLDAGGATSYARPVRGDERRLSVEQRKVKRGVIIAKIRPGSEDKVAALFARSDETDLPELAGVVHRSLFVLDDVYVHYVEMDDDFQEKIDEIRDHPLFQEISRRLDDHISPYNPETWKSPKDAQAREFYVWDADEG